MKVLASKTLTWEWKQLTTRMMGLTLAFSFDVDVEREAIDRWSIAATEMYIDMYDLADKTRKHLDGTDVVADEPENRGPGIDMVKEMLEADVERERKARLDLELSGVFAGTDDWGTVAESLPDVEF